MEAFPQPKHSATTEPLFAEIASIAARACGVPFALIALTHAGVHRVVGRHGDLDIDALEGRKDVGLCCRVVHSCAYLEVADAAFDLRFHDDELVAARGIRFYAGVPLLAPEHDVRGVLCVMGIEPGTLDVAQRLTLEQLGHVVVKLLAARRTEREAAEALSWQASHDALTDLVNRREFERVAGRLLESARLHLLEHAVLFIDLDQFKVVNDTCGHLAGDALLKQLAGLLPAALRKSDTLARLGGDEFGVLLEGCEIGQATRVAEQVLAAIRGLRFQWAGQVFAVSASIGVAAIRPDDDDVDRVLSAADTACFLAKDKGRNQVQVFRLEDEEISSRRGELGWAARLAQCVEEQRFFLLCQRVQPLSAPDSGEPEYLELLLRMRDESGGTVLPMAFIPAAERYNLMGSIDRWVMAKTLSCLQRMRLEGGIAMPRFAINLSGMSLCDAGLLDFILAQFDRTGVAPASICFEVTETAAVANLARAARLMHRLREMGCRFALDDFGSGLSSFSYLRNLPVDYLKIDGSFVRTVASDGVNLAMVDAIRRVGEVMGIRTIAESVESLEVLERVRDIGIDFAQGWFIHTPETVVAWRASRAAAVAFAA